MIFHYFSLFFIIFARQARNGITPPEDIPLPATAVRATAAFEAALPRSVAEADDNGSKSADGNGSKGAGAGAEDSDEDSGGEAVPTVKQFNTSRKVRAPWQVVYGVRDAACPISTG